MLRKENAKALSLQSNEVLVEYSSDIERYGRRLLAFTLLDGDSRVILMASRALRIG